MSLIIRIFHCVQMKIFSFSYSFFLFLLFMLKARLDGKIYFMEAKIFLVFSEHKKEKLFLSEKEKIFFRLLSAK